MSGYKPYPEYKDSGVEWIGEVPAHWSLWPMKRATRLRKDRSNTVPDGIAYVGMEDVESGSGRYIPTDCNARFSDDSLVGIFDPGNVLYGKLRPYLRKSMVAQTQGVCSTEFLVFEEGAATPTWLNRWLLTPEVTQEIEAGCEGAKMPRADWGRVGSLPITLPSRSEQTAITTALNHETTRIDALIEKKTRFIELLKEKRQALITHAVTKGLDPDVPMKDSGVEWIGEVPAGWEVCKLGHRYKVELGKMLDQKKNTGQYSMPYLRNQDVQWGRVNKVDLPVMDVRPHEWLRYTLRVGDILVCEGGDAGRCAIWNGEDDKYAFQKALHRLRPIRKDRDIPSFVENLLIAAHGSGTYLSDTTTTFSHLTGEKLRFACFPFPDWSEQRRIVLALQTALERIEAAELKVEESIDLLKERRSALITAAVTGKIDLRNAARCP